MAVHTTSAPLRFQEIKAGEVRECRNSRRVTRAEPLRQGPAAARHPPAGARTGHGLNLRRDTNIPGNSSSPTETQPCTPVPASSLGKACRAAEGGLDSRPCAQARAKQHRAEPLARGDGTARGTSSTLAHPLPAAKRAAPGRRGVERRQRGRVGADSPLSSPSPNICADVNRRGRARLSI